jgi:NAD(P)-dependent dehydrogenase (short-subunit alcohol dehydrogenase family)
MAPIRLDGQVAVVTGGGNGLGREYALALAQRGARVVVNDLGGTTSGSGADSAVAQRVVEEIERAGGVAVANTDSVASPEGGEAIVETAMRAFGRLDALVSNAGVLRNDLITDSRPEDIDLVLAVHLGGSFNVLRPAMGRMQEQRYGRVVMISSAAGMFGNEYQAGYAAAKCGIVGLANVAALEGHAHGVLVNSVMPLARTRMVEGMEGKGHDASTSEAEAMLSQIPAAAVAPLVVYLASNTCQTTKAVFSAGAGRFARVVVGLTPGWLAPDPLAVTPEDVHARLHEIIAPENLTEPRSVGEEVASLIRRVQLER